MSQKVYIIFIKPFHKKISGFTLIELLVVIAITGLLSTIIASPIQNARKKSRDAKKIAELKAVQTALDQYAEANNQQYPKTLSDLYPLYMSKLPDYATTTVAPRDRFAYVMYDTYQYIAGDGVTRPISMPVTVNDTFACSDTIANLASFGYDLTPVVTGYHIGVHLDTYNQALDSDADCVGFSTPSLPDNSFSFLDPTSCALYSLDNTVTCAQYTNYVSGMIKNPSHLLNIDFIGSDTGTTTCSAVNDCVLDFTNHL